jgi:hypothetical protein
MEIGFVWGFFDGRAGRLTAENGGFAARAVEAAARAHGGAGRGAALLVRRELERTDFLGR